MASILVLHHAGASVTGITGSMTSLGHTVTTATSTSSGTLNTLWSSSGPFDVIAIFTTESDAHADWASIKWAAGVPLLVGHHWAASSIGVRLGMGASWSEASTAAAITITGSHAITSGLSGSVSPVVSAQYRAWLGTPRGTVAATHSGSSVLAAMETGDAIRTVADGSPASPGSTAPARAVFMGWLQRNVTLTTDGATLLGNAVTWLDSGGTPIPTGSASGAFTWAGSAVGKKVAAGVAAGAFAFSGAAVGVSARSGSAAGAFTWAGAAAGVAPAPDVAEGSAAGAFTWSGAASGASNRSGSAAGAFTWAGTAVASTVHAGTASGSFAWAGYAVGSDDGTPSGFATGTFTWDGEAEGDNLERPGSFGWVGSATATAVEGYVEHPVSGEPLPPFLERRLMRQSHQMPVPELVDGYYRSDGTYPIIEEEVGSLRTWIDGVDVTYLLDIPVLPGAMRSSLPGADETASIEFPQVHPFDARTGDLSVLRPDAPVEIAIVPETGGRIHLFAGHLVSDNVDQGPSSNSETWHVEGTLAQADHAGHAVPVTLDPTDIGTLVPDALNSVVSRRYPLIPRVTTGINSVKRGAYGDTKLDYASDLLATAWTTAARQWTIARTGTPRKFEMVLKDTTTAHHRLTAGAPGIACNLTEDHAERIDVIYGRGVSSEGYSWAGWHFPGFHDYDPPDYPFPHSDTVLNLGSTGAPVTVVQTRLRDLGFSIAITGTYSAATKATVLAFQSRRDIKKDGVVGPQTWNELHNLGTNNLQDPIRLPLAGRTECMPYLYDDSGTVTGPNPAYDKDIVVHEIDIDYGVGVTKAEAIVSANRQLARDTVPGWAGTITMLTCPWYTSRWEVFEGQNIELLGWRGETILVHVVEVTKDPLSGVVTVTVDTKARDAMTLSSILTRDRASRVDPARRPGNVNRRSRQEKDMAVDFDWESPAGRMPRIPLFRGLWTVWTIPLSQVGTLAKTIMTTDAPACEFYFGVFGRPITANQMAALVGNPANEDAWTKNEAILDERYGWIDSWGDSSEAAGHYPKGADGPVTGKLVDTAGCEYVSQRPPWVWVAFYSPASTFVGGRFLPGPVT